jgi:formate dehydrogenase iron-sulfur subunit
MTTMTRFLVHLLYPFLRTPLPQLRTPTGFFTDTSVCIGCKACEVACKAWNELPADALHITGHSYDNTGTLSAESWRHVKFIEQFEPPVSPFERGAEGEGERVPLDVLPLSPEPGRWLMMSDVCKHCVSAPCHQACPTGAIIQTEFTNIFIQPDICNGCAYCVAACPFGVVTRSACDGHAHKCTLCYDRQQHGLVPACAKACPTQSIQFGPIDDLRQRARERVARLHQQGVTAAHLYGDVETDGYSALTSFYLLLDRPAVYGLPEAPHDPYRRMAGDYLRSIAGGLISLVALGLLIWSMRP